MREFWLRWIIWLSVYSIVDSTFTKDVDCGVTKGCFSDCEDDVQCTYLISWSNGSSTVTFTILTEVSTNTEQYVSLGLSPTQSMGDASVSSCIMTNNGASFDYENSYNSGTHNKLVSNPKNGLSSFSGIYVNNLLKCTFTRTKVNVDSMVFDLRRDYYMLYAAGPVSAGIKKKHTAKSFSSEKISLLSMSDIGEGSPARVKAHGSIAIIAWMLFINIGSVIVRWYKPLWSGKIILGSAVWFIIHRILMVTGAILTITAFCVIIHGSFDVGETNFQHAHPYIGVTILCLVTLNPVLGILRPSKDNKYRPLFYWTHYTIGLFSTVLASINIFIGVQLKKAVTSGSAFILLIAFEVCRVLMIIILEVLLIIEKGKEKKVEISYQMFSLKGSTEMTSNSSTENLQSQSQMNTPPFAWRAKLILLGIHIFISVASTISMVIIVATSTSSG